MNGVDLARFEFDYDTTWTSFFLDADLNIYSRYGGRDERVADARMSRESLLQTMSDVLQVHRQIATAPEAERPTLTATETHPRRMASTTPEDIPLLSENHQGCVHCHQVQEYRLLQAYQDGKFERRMLFGYPQPESLGITLQAANGQQVATVQAESAAARAGLQPDDRLRRVNDVVIRSEYDLRWALHHAADDGPLTIQVSRRGDGNSSPPVTLKLTPTGPWRESDLGWRKSLRSVPLPLGFLGYSLSPDAVKELGFPESQSLVKVISLRPPGLARHLQLQKGDYILSVGGITNFRTFDQFKSRILQRYRPGDDVEFEVLRDGQRIRLKGKLPDWFTEETSVP